MAFWIASLAGLLGAYLLGATPTAWLAGRLLKDIDIREYGSRSVGATNALRVLGPWPALAVLIVDVAKGAAAVLLVRALYAWPAAAAAPGLDLAAFVPWAVCLAGAAALLGHARPVWLGFKGGKSVATGLGVLLAIAWPVGVGGLVVFALAVAAFRIVSLGSVLAAVTAIVLVCVLSEPLAYRLLVVAGGLYVIARHRPNLQRLLAGTEPRLGQGAR